MLRCLVCFAGLGLASVAAAGDWPQWLGPNRDGSSPEEIKPWTQPLKTVWKIPVGEGQSSPIVAPGASVVAFNRKSGEVNWQAGDDPASYASPILVAGRPKELDQAIFLAAIGARGYTARTGKERWFHPFKDKLNESSSTPVFSAG